MAHFFKFHSLSDLEAECRRLGLDLRFDEDLSPLFRPARIGPLRAGNSLCIQPMEGCDGTLDGRPDELTFRRYQRFGAGGAKLIWGEATAVAPEGRANTRQLLINDETLPDLENMLRVCRQAHRAACGNDDDLIVGLQLTHSGRYCFQKPLIPADLTDDYLKRLTDHYVSAAKRAYRAGFQFIDIKQCHGYLLNEMLGAFQRPGPYGGCLENRTRLGRDIITGIRKEVPGLVIASRLNVLDRVAWRSETNSWGSDLTEPLQWIAAMLGLGVACVNVTMGNPYVTPHLTRPFEYPPPDAKESPEHPLLSVDRHFRLAEVVQRAFPSAPIVGSAYSYLQEFLGQAGAANIRMGRITFVGVGRAVLAQPDFVRQLQENGKLDRRRTCRTFSYCTALMRSKHNDLGQFATGCPPFDKEVYGPIWEQAKEKTV